MAVNITTPYNGVDLREFDVEATADGDTTASIFHGLSSVPSIYITPLADAAALSLWRVTTITATQIVCTKSTTGGSGAAGVQLRVTAFNRGARRMG